MDAAEDFEPNADLARALLDHVTNVTTDRSHDLSHLLRVWRNFERIAAREGGDLRILTAATLLHDCVDVPKNAPGRSSASRLAAERASALLASLGWVGSDINAVAHAIEAHSFSAAIAPKTLEAKILQDADRLDAIGYIGIARCLYLSGRINRAIYDPEDPAAKHRPLDDGLYALDQFQTKLLKLSRAFQTPTGQRLADQRHKAVFDFLNGLLEEVSDGVLTC